MNEPESRDEVFEELIDAEVERAMAPYAGLGLPAEVLAEMEALLRFGLRHHPTARELLRALAADPVVVESDQVDIHVVDGSLEKAGEEPS